MVKFKTSDVLPLHPSAAHTYYNKEENEWMQKMELKKLSLDKGQDIKDFGYADQVSRSLPKSLSLSISIKATL